MNKKSNPIMIFGYFNSIYIFLIKIGTIPLVGWKLVVRSLGTPGRHCQLIQVQFPTLDQLNDQTDHTLKPQKSNNNGHLCNFTIKENITRLFLFSKKGKKKLKKYHPTIK
jgi:hypothetical protein